MRPVTSLPLAAVANSPVVVPDFRSNVPQIDTSVILSAGAALTYTVQITTDDVFAPGYNPATGNWLPHPVAALVAATTSQNANLTLPVTGVRLSVTAYTSGTATMKTICAGGPGG